MVWAVQNTGHWSGPLIQQLAVMPVAQTAGACSGPAASATAIAISKVVKAQPCSSQAVQMTVALQGTKAPQAVQMTVALQVYTNGI
jgi:hypothetical protein